MRAAAALRRAIVSLTVGAVVAGGLLVTAPRALAADTTAPTLGTFTVADRQVTPPATVQVAYRVNEEPGTELNRVAFVFTNPGGFERFALAAGAPLSGTVSLDLRNGDRNGTWALTRIELVDAAGNNATYQRDGRLSTAAGGVTRAQTHDVDLASGDVTVTGSDADTAPPVLSGLTLSPADITPTTLLSIETDVTDVSRVAGMTVRLVHRDLGHVVSYTDQTDIGAPGSLQVRLGHVANGAWSVQSVRLWDDFGNRAEYLASGDVTVSPADATGPSTHDLPFATTFATLTGSSKDTTAPVLSAFTAPTGVVDPGKAVAATYAVDDASPLTFVRFTYVGPGGGWTLARCCNAPTTGEVEGALPTTPGTYTLSSVYVADPYSNTRLYRADGTGVKMPGSTTFTHDLDLASSFTVRTLPPSTPPGLWSEARSTEVALGWGDEPTYAPVTGYTLTVSPGGRTFSLPSAAREQVVTGLANGTTYTFSLVAHGPEASSPAATVRATPRMSPRVTGAGDLTGDGRPDVLAQHDDGRLLVYRGSGSSAFRPGAVDAGRWMGPRQVAADVGDFDGRYDREVLYVQGDQLEGVTIRGGEGVGAGRYGSRGWAGTRFLVGPGDLDGDRRLDLLAVSAGGALRLYPGDGAGGFLPTRTLGTGWGSMLSVFTPGDFDGDRRVDLLAVAQDGSLLLYRGNGRGSFLAARKVGSGWAGFMTVFSSRDFSGDGRADVLAATTQGDLYLYRGNGRGGLLSGRSKIGSGWQAYR